MFSNNINSSSLTSYVSSYADKNNITEAEAWRELNKNSPGRLEKNIDYEIDQRRESIFKGIQEGKLNKLEAYKLLKDLSGIEKLPGYNTRSKTGASALEIRDKLEALDGKIARYRKGDCKPNISELNGESGETIKDNFAELYNGMRTGKITERELTTNFGELNTINDKNFGQKQVNGKWVDLTDEELADKIDSLLDKNYIHIDNSLGNKKVDQKQEIAYEDGDITLAENTPVENTPIPIAQNGTNSNAWNLILNLFGQVNTGGLNQFAQIFQSNTPNTQTSDDSNTASAEESNKNEEANKTEA